MKNDLNKSKRIIQRECGIENVDLDKVKLF